MDTKGVQAHAGHLPLLARETCLLVTHTGCGCGGSKDTTAHRLSCQEPWDLVKRPPSTIKGRLQARLKPGRQGTVMTHLLEEVLWDLGGLPGARLALNDEDLVIGDGGQELLPEGEHRKAAADSLDGLLLGLGRRGWP